MLQINEIRKEKGKVIRALEKRGIKNIGRLLDGLLEIDDRRKLGQKELDSVLEKSNQRSKLIGMLIKEGNVEEADKAKKEAAQLRSHGKLMTDNLGKLEIELRQALYAIPNLPNEAVCSGSSSDDNEIVFSQEANNDIKYYGKPHWEIVKNNDLINFDEGNKITGTGFPVYKREMARLVRGLVNYFIDQGTKAGYHEVQVPSLINEESGYGTGNLPDKEGQMYGIKNTELYLIPTAEVPITNLYRNVILKEEDLPIKHIGYTPCFRREAGSWGAHVRGLNRLHQFDKVELVQITSPEQSYNTLNQMVKYVESLVKGLGLPYRILRLCAKDLGFTSALTYDFEVFSGGQQKWLEISSVSNFEAYQANRLKLRYKNKNKEKILAHTLNGSALAIPRLLAALIENNFNGKSIGMPPLLRPYLGFDKISIKK